MGSSRHPWTRAYGSVRLFALVALLSAGSAVPAQAQPPANAAPDWVSADQRPTAFETEPSAPHYHDYFRALAYSFTHGLAARAQLPPLAVGTAATLAFVPFDREISDRVRGKAISLGSSGEVVGHPITLTALSGGLLLGSLATHRSRFRAYTFSLSQALIIGSSLTSIIKPAVHRTRPDGQNNFSFPSGHAAGSFALATVTTQYYGRKAGIPLFGLATLVVASRVSRGKHFPTDVMAGAMVGYISGRAAFSGTRHVRSGQPGGAGSPVRKRAIVIAPLLAAGGGTGVGFSLSF